VNETYENTKLPMVLADHVGLYVATPAPAVAYMFGGMGFTREDGEYYQPFQMEKFTLFNGKFQVELLSQVVFENTFLPSELSEIVGGYAATTEERVPDEIHGLERSYSVSCVINGTVYALGGTHGNQRPAMYYTLTDTWDTTSLPQMPLAPRTMFTAVPVGSSKIYVVGGNRSNRLNDMLLLDLETTPPRWTTVVDAQCPRYCFTASCELDGVIYMFGGMEKRNDDWNLVDSVYTYNTKGDHPTWKLLGTRMPAATLSDHNALVVHDDKMYLFGFNDVYSRGMILTVFDPREETFVQLESHLSECIAMYPFLLNDGYIYVVHGYGRLISKYDVKRDVWEILDIVIPSERRIGFNVVSI
jgi:hypothetical protein